MPHLGAADVIRAVGGSGGDLGMFALDGGPGAGAWWTRLAPPDAPKIIARLPFVERADHPAGMPVFVISKPLVDGAAREVVLELVTLDRWRADLPDALRGIGAEVIGSAANGMGLALLVARPGGRRGGRGERGAAIGRRGRRARLEVGAHADRFDASALRKRAN